VDGGRMFARKGARRHPGKLPVILLHGLGVSSSYMVPLAKLLCTTHDVWAPDLPGYGRSDHPAHALDIKELTKSLLAWTQANGIDRAVYCANSMGCQVITQLAAEHPARVAGLVLLSPTFDLSSRGIFRNILHLAEDALREPPGLVALQAYDYWHNGPLRTIRTFFHARRHPMLQRLGQVRSPALVIWGDADPIVSRQWAKQVTSAIPSANLLVVPDAPHALNYNSPAIVAEAMRRIPGM
jgi:2-hydroxy-6-oxonona-2,4-dienedioate hydrolase